MAGHKALGRGLEALFNASARPPARDVKAASPENSPVELSPNEIRELAIENIKPNRYQPRTHFDPAALEELAASIKQHGLAQPIAVTETAAPGNYELVVGERRLRASKLAGLTTVHCTIKKLTNRQRFELALIENIQRQDLNALEEATAIDGLMKEHDLTQEAVAAALGKSRSAVANTLRLLSLHENVQAALREGRITEGHAKCLAGLTEHSEQLRFLEKLLAENLSVRDLEVLLAEGKPAKKTGSGKATPLPEVKKYEEEFQRVLGRRVEIQTKGKKGWIRFAFYSPWDLDLLCKRLGLIEEIRAEQSPEDNGREGVKSHL